MSVSTECVHVASTGRTVPLVLWTMERSADTPLSTTSNSCMLCCRHKPQQYTVSDASINSGEPLQGIQEALLSQRGHALLRVIERCELNLRRVAMTGDGRRRLLTVKNRRRPSPVVAARRRCSSNDRHCIDWPRVCPDCEEPATTVNFVAESSRIVAGSMHSGKLN